MTDREEMMAALILLLGQPERQSTHRDGSKSYISMFWAEKHATVTLWSDGTCALSVGGPFDEMIDVIVAIRELPISGFNKQTEE